MPIFRSWGNEEEQAKTLGNPREIGGDLGKYNLLKTQEKGVVN